jgi:enoyl-CoA hydratase/carnithine racemase
MMLLGTKMSGEQAAGIGLVNSAVRGDQLDAAVKEITDAIGKKSPLTVGLGLRAFAAQDGMELEKALPMLRDKLAEILGTEDAREGLMAFLEKRPPVWKGK